MYKSMCTTCGRAVDALSTACGLVAGLCKQAVRAFGILGISQGCTQFCTQALRTFVHTKLSFFIPVSQKLSTLSTRLTITTTNSLTNHLGKPGKAF